MPSSRSRPPPADGLILTNYHVVEGADQLTVTLKDGTELPGTVVATDQTHDLAVVKVAGADLPTVPLGSSADLKVGQLVVAIGSPLGTFTETVTSGILSGTGRTITVASAGSGNGQTLNDLLQTDAAINEGNSGGPLLDAAGQVVGINTAVASSAQGIGFATPIDIAAAVIAQARTATAAPS
jgi:S1-C subfamily serine protease